MWISGWPPYWIACSKMALNQKGVRLTYPGTEPILCGAQFRAPSSSRSARGVERTSAQWARPRPDALQASAIVPSTNSVSEPDPVFILGARKRTDLDLILPFPTVDTA